MDRKAIIRKLRNRIFHHEAITWNYIVIVNYQKEILEGIDWLDKGLVEWSQDIFRLKDTIRKNKDLWQP